MDEQLGDEGPDDTVIDHALELLVYAPLGFALEARTLLPRFVDRGRNQLALARVVGKFAVRKGREDVEAKLLDGQAQAVGLLRSVGLVPAQPPQARPSDTAGAPDGEHPASEPPGPTATTASPTPAGAAHDATSAPPAESVPAVPLVDPDALAIPGYDSLSASQVVPRLDSLTADELELVRCYELGNRGRKTILAKIAQLQSV